MDPNILFEQPDRRANPEAMAASPELVPFMTSQASRNGISGTADKLPPVYRDGAMDAQALPSRMGKRLVFRDGTTREVGQ